jgi:hypothetical protein
MGHGADVKASPSSDRRLPGYRILIARPPTMASTTGWLPFGIWMVASLGLLPRRAARWGLALQVLVALAINHLMTMNW